jgi:hypothetical protein
MRGRGSFASLLVTLAVLSLAGCATPRRWSAPPKAALSVEAAAAVARELGPGCPPDKIYADEFKDLIQASGCGKLVYLEKAPGEKGAPAEWKRAGPEFELPPENDLHEAELRLQGARLKAPVRVSGVTPFITLEQAKTLHSWNPKAVITCLLGVDGALHACLVQADEPPVEKAVAATVPSYRFKPATADGVPVPATFQATINVPVPRPNCDGFSDPLRQFRCERDVRSPAGPAAADPEIWSLPLGH